jgi:hypothetical protein
MQHADTCEYPRGLVQLQSGRQRNRTESMRRGSRISEVLEPGGKFEAELHVFTELQRAPPERCSLVEATVARG